MKMRSVIHILLPALLSLTFMKSACVTNTNDPDLRLQNMTYFIGYGGNPKAKERLLGIIAGAKQEVVGVFSDLADTDVSNALIERANAGIKVAVGGDQRSENNAGFAALKAMRSSNKFLDYYAATNAAEGEPNLNLKNKILATRLNFNRLNRSTKYNASAYDGRVEYNFVVADKYNCWISTGGANSSTFDSGFSIVFVFQSFDICNDFYNEAQQLAYGGLFGDEGVPSFGKFRNSKTVTDPNTRFRLGDLIFNIYFAPQEKPLVPVVTELLRAEETIQFAARALTQDIIADVTSHPANRSNILNVMQYKARMPQVYGKAFKISGVIGTETDSMLSVIPSPWTAYSAPFSTLVSGTCPTVNTITVNLPFKDTDNNAIYNANKIMTTSVHCDMKTLADSVNNTGVIDVRKHPLALPFNIFLIDAAGRKPRLVIMSSDLRKRFYYDSSKSQEAEPKRTQNAFFHITDAFVMVIEPAGSTTDKKIFDDFGTLLSRFLSAGGSL